MKQRPDSNRYKRFGALRRGFTLVELLVVLLILGIVAAIAGSFLAGSFEVIQATETRARLNNNARAALNQMTESIRTASSIPRGIDRNKNGLVDDDFRDFGEDATWVIGDRDSTEGPFVPVSFYQSEAFSDRLMLEHQSGFEQVGLFSNSVRDVYSGSDYTLKLPGSSEQRVASRRSLFQLALPADFTPPPNGGGTPYYMAPANSSRHINQNIRDYPAVVSFGGGSETAVLTEYLFYDLQSYDTVTQASASTGGASGAIPNTGTTQSPVQGTPQLGRSEETITAPQQPVASNITRLRFEYLHEVPVYMGDPDDNCDPRLVDTNDNGTPDKPVVVDHILVPIDVAENGNGLTSSNYNDLYTDSLSKDARASRFEAWNMDDYYTLNDPEREPPDHRAYIRCPGQGTSFEELDFDIEDLRGFDPTDPESDGDDNGSADGIPDGDGIPDDPVPCWWLPYIKAIRVSLVTTPTSVIEERRNNSGRLVDVDKDGNQEEVFYKLDSPHPHTYEPTAESTEDPFRAHTNDPSLFIGEGKDIVVTETVRTENMPSQTPATDPADQRLESLRRVDFNLLQGKASCASDFGERESRSNAVDAIRRLAQRLGVSVIDLF